MNGCAIVFILTFSAIVALEAAAGNIAAKNNRSLKGAKGQKGDKGSHGEKGSSGLKGYRGHQGNKGEKGIKGDRGPSGNVGFPGIKGDKGDLGPPGNVTSSGGKGDKGQPGLTGNIGAPGRKGEAGHKGVKGEKGEFGLPGPWGPPGAKGDKGVPGEKGECQKNIDGTEKDSRGKRTRGVRGKPTQCEIVTVVGEAEFQGTGSQEKFNIVCKSVNKSVCLVGPKTANLHYTVDSNTYIFSKNGFKVEDFYTVKTDQLKHLYQEYLSAVLKISITCKQCDADNLRRLLRIVLWNNDSIGYEDHAFEIIRDGCKEQRPTQGLACTEIHLKSDELPLKDIKIHGYLGKEQDIVLNLIDFCFELLV